MESNSQEFQVNWYTAKLLFESIHSGNPIPNEIDQHNFANNDKLFEESIILVKAVTMKQAYEIAEELAKKSEHEYMNVYGELVKWQFVRILHAFKLNDKELTPGTEIYSRFIHAKRDNSINDIIMRYYPEALDTD
ncbi:MAG: DUF4288 domain-containing protein [Bacillota bacterium]